MSETQDPLSRIIRDSWWLKLFLNNSWGSESLCIASNLLKLGCKVQNCIAELHRIAPGFKVQSWIAPSARCWVAELHCTWLESAELQGRVARCRVAMKSCKAELQGSEIFPVPPLKISSSTSRFAMHQTVRLDVSSTSRFAPNCKIGCKIHLSLCTKL